MSGISSLGQTTTSITTTIVSKPKSTTNTNNCTNNISTTSSKDNISNLGKGLACGSVSAAGIALGSVSTEDTKATGSSHVTTNKQDKINFDNSISTGTGYDKFQDAFYKFTKDGVLNKDEFNKLKELAKSPDIKKNKVDEKVVNSTMDTLFSEDKTRLEALSIARNPETKNYEVAEFQFTPTYNEDDKIEGKTPFEIVSNISQMDSLPETKNDGIRCAPSSLLNAYILMDGKFENLAKKFGVDSDLTYKNLHKLQEQLYNVGNTDGKSGLTGYLSYEFIDPKIEGEIKPLAEKMNLEIKPLTGMTFIANIKDGFHLARERKKSVDNFFNSNPKGTIVLGVRVDEGLSNANKLPANHAVIVFKKNNDFYLANTGGITNGNNKSIKKLSEEEVNDLIYTNQSAVAFGLTLK